MQLRQKRLFWAITVNETPDPAKRFFRVMPNSVPGQAPWRIEGRPDGKRQRFYFQTERVAKQAANDRNATIEARGSQNVLSNAQQVMAAECIRVLQHAFDIGFIKTANWDRGRS